MEFYDVVEGRRSIRRYKDKPVEKEKLYRVLESLTCAPSWSCNHCWKFIIVDDDEIKRKITDCIPETNEARRGVTEAPAIVVLCADPRNAEEIDNKEYYMADCGIAMESFILSAENEGLATCWIGLFDEDKMKILFDTPEDIRIVALSPLGYPDENPDRKKNRGIKDMTFSNKWDNELVFK